MPRPTWGRTPQAPMHSGVQGEFLMQEKARAKKASAMPRRKFLAVPLKSVLRGAPCLTLLGGRLLAGQRASCPYSSHSKRRVGGFQTLRWFKAPNNR